MAKKIMIIVRDDCGLPRAWATGPANEEAEVRARADREWAARIARRTEDGTLDLFGGDTRGETTLHEVDENAVSL